MPTVLGDEMAAYREEPALGERGQSGGLFESLKSHSGALVRDGLCH
jgi:hypothetical protein